MRTPPDPAMLTVLKTHSPLSCLPSNMDGKALIGEFKTALDDEIEYLKEHGGDKKLVCKNGVLVHAGGNRYVYEFLLEVPTSVQEDTPISIRFGSETVLGSVVLIEGVKITLALNQNIGQKVAEITVIANPYFLLELLKEKLNELETNKIPGNIALALKVFGEEKPVIANEDNFLSKGIGKLNREQQEAVARALGSNLAFIWGPPGTGKTFLLAQLVGELLERNKTALIASHTNIAIDNALERLSFALKQENDPRYYDGKILRLGNPHLPTLFAEYPELDVGHWVEKKGQVYREELQQLERQAETHERAMKLYAATLQLFSETEMLDKKIGQLTEGLRSFEGKLENTQQEISGLKTKLALLEDKLSRAENTNAVARFFRGLNVDKIKSDISETRRLVSQREFALQDSRAALEKTVAARKETQAQLMTKKAELQKQFQSIGGALSKEAVAQKLEELERKVNEVSEQKKAIEKILANLEGQIISEALVVGTTLTKTYLNQNIYRRQFDVTLVDEAGMAPMPALFFSCSLSKEKAVIIGDFRQLAPIAQGDSPLVHKWLARDIFEQVGLTSRVNNNEADERLVPLKEQRRMPDEVVDLVNNAIYGGMLRTGPKSAAEKSTEEQVYAGEPFSSQRIVICDTSAVNPWCGRSTAGSPFNVYNAFLSVALAELAIKNNISDIGIITPYSSQGKLTHELVAERKDLPVDPSSVHRFQGREKQFIIFDLVEGPVRNIIWLNGGRNTDAARLINVAVTRAKAKLVFIANLDYLDNKLAPDSVLRLILDKAKKSGVIVDSRQFFTFVDVAERRKAMEGTELPKNADLPSIYSELYFYEKLREDLSSAKDSVVIMSPFITVNRTTQFEELFRGLLAKGVKLYVVTRPPQEQVGQLETMGQEMVRELKKLGVEIVLKKHLHEKLAIVDKRIIWHGSLNILSHRNTSELMARFFATPSWTSTLLNICGVSIDKIDRAGYVDKKLKELNDVGVGRCPRGHKMVVRHGRYGVFVSCSEYPRCQTTVQADEGIVAAVYGEEYMRCEKCGSEMNIKFSPKNRSRFLGCSTYPTCRFTRPL